MSFCDEELNALQRTFGMTFCSLPFWVFCGIYAWNRVGMPSAAQCAQSLAVALFSGVIATIFFFKATDMVKNDSRMLAAVEATQCGEVIFTSLLSLMFLQDAAPTPAGWIGVGMIVAGMVLTSVVKES